MNRLARLVSLAAASLVLSACAASEPPEPAQPTQGAEREAAREPAPAPRREPPPEPSAPRELSFPETTKSELESGLELLALPSDALPIAYAQLVIRSGNAASPPERPGLASLVASMLEQGTKKKGAAKLAEAIEFLGASLSVRADADSLVLTVRSLSEHFDEALGLLAEVATQPAFDAKELTKLKKRELDRLKLAARDPDYVARRAFYAALYGDHPYAAIDTTEEAVEAVTRRELAAWHRAHVIPNNAFLVVAGDVDPGALDAQVEKAFARWKPRELDRAPLSPPAEASGRRVVLIDRPESVQSAIRIGNLALPRSSDDWIPLEVANEVLGGSSSSRLFMDLREKRSFTYGAYSAIAERRAPGAFVALAQVRNEVTLPAVSAFFEHLERITTEAPPASELGDAKSSLGNSFPLSVETTGKIVDLVTKRALHGLADDYWSTYRAKVADVSADQALEQARRYIRPEDALVVIVGRAADLAEPLRALGPVTLMDVDGEVLETLEAVE